MTQAYITRLLIATSALSMLPCAAFAQEASGSDDAIAREIVVTATSSVRAGKTDVPVLETPQNIQVLSSALLEDQGSRLLDDALRNVAGVSSGGVARAFDLFRIRGFDASSSTYVDGLPRGVAINVELAGIEQVEVIKGPSSGLYGRGSAGGLINLVSKRPQPGAFVTIEGSIGSYHSTNAMIDGGGPLDASGAIYGRVVANYRNDRSFIDFRPQTERLYIAPSLTWEPSSRTKITFLASLSKDWSELVPGQPAAGLVFAGPRGFYDRNLYIGDPANKGRLLQTFTTGGFDLSHEVSDSVTLYSRGRIADLDLSWLNLQQPLAYDPVTGIQSEFSQDYYEDRQIYGLDSGARITARTGAIEHRILAGVEYDGRRLWSQNFLGFAPGVNFDLYDPDYSVFVHQPRVESPATSSRSDAFGFYAQDNMKIGPATLLLGLRYDTVDLDGETVTAWSPNVGATVELDEGLAAFASFAKSFTPQAGLLDIDGEQIAPERGTQYELGLKYARGPITATMSIYDLTRSNVATGIPDAPGRYSVTGKQRSRGFEFDTQLSVLPGWQVVANYAYTDAEILADNILPVGDRVLGVPRHQFGLWNRYEFRDGTLRGLSFSLGGSYLSKQAGGVPNTYMLPSYMLINANVARRRGPVSVRMNVNNLFNKRYFQSAVGEYFVVSGAPRTAMLTLGLRY